MANNDNVMARFLFAILQQKCLKDINWNEVACSPILAQPITNGHAARMRYSRFRTAVLGIEPQRRNRTTAASKNRVTKRKREDDPKPKKDEDEPEPGSGIGNIKRETAAIIKSERKSISQHTPRAPSQPPAPMMATPAMMKREPGLAHPYSQHLAHPSMLATASPNIKHEALPTPGANGTTPPMHEPSLFGMLATTPAATNSASSTPYIDSGSHHRMQMRLLTPCSDSDGGVVTGLQGFLPQSPGADLLLHNHSHSQSHSQSQHHYPSHHSQSHNPQAATVGAGSPPPPPPYELSQGCCDTTTTAGGSPIPWHTQSQPPLSHHLHHHHGLQQAAVYAHPPPAFDLNLGLGIGMESYSNGNTANTANDDTSNPFCTHHHPHHHDDETQHAVVDTLGLHHPHTHHSHSHHSHSHSHHTHGAGAGGASLFRERELELQMGCGGEEMGIGMGQVKVEWEREGDAFGI
ncbi:hypothetical protein C8A05DRAFT_14681 [Staphylotrichum tortipilum]|uniref:Uncharacterized protein n=1 Tax=Staphylotrichum tortipilum TaxID=2831512 RepID=A0AAN6MN86_9PEZI|nr:hypothetical protein C8A05DRAFT_14681 [Staphylotrichum longicolle]